MSGPGGPPFEGGLVLALPDHVDDLRRLDAVEGSKEQGKALAPFEAPAQEETLARERRSDRSRREEVGAYAVGNHHDLLLRPCPSDQRGQERRRRTHSPGTPKRPEEKRTRQGVPEMEAIRIEAGDVRAMGREDEGGFPAGRTHDGFGDPSVGHEAVGMNDVGRSLGHDPLQKRAGRRAEAPHLGGRAVVGRGAATGDPMHHEAAPRLARRKAAEAHGHEVHKVAAAGQLFRQVEGHTPGAASHGWQLAGDHEQGEAQRPPRVRTTRSASRPKKRV